MDRLEFALAVDSTGRSDLAVAKKAWREVVERYGATGVRLGKPVSLVIEEMPIMGATQSTAEGHRLHIAAHAVASGMLRGLMAHEMGHMVLTERGHPSHSIDVLRRAESVIEVPAGQRPAYTGVARGAINHVQDIYADDLAIPLIGDGRASLFFSDWVRTSARVRRDRWETVGNAVSIAFALGNLERHRLRPDDDARNQAKTFAEAAPIPSLEILITSYAGLPASDETRLVSESIRILLARVVDEGLRQVPLRS